jgi:hypothetical protein
MFGKKRKLRQEEWKRINEECRKQEDEEFRIKWIENDCIVKGVMEGIITPREGLDIHSFLKKFTHDDTTHARRMEIINSSIKNRRKLKWNKN